MPELSLRDINQICSDISRQEITFSHLPEELIDHVCCDVEYEMQKGFSFNEAYQIIKERMGKRRLKEIQEETLYAVDTKYRQMKNTMKISGIAGTVLLAFAALFKIMHWPGAGIMISVGALTLAFIFMPSALGVLWKETHSGKRLFLYISAFFAGMLFIAGAVFKVQHWQGAGVLIILAALCGNIFFIPSLLLSKLRDQEKSSKKIVYILGAAGLIFYITGMLCRIMHWTGSYLFLLAGIVIIFLVVFPWYTWLTWKDERNVSARFIFMVIGSLAVMVPSALLNLNLRRDYEAGYFEHQMEQRAMFNYLYSINQSFLNNHKDSAALVVLMQVHSHTSDLLAVINGIEAEMVAESEGDPGRPAVVTQQIIKTERGPEIQFRLLSNAFDNNPVRDFLLPSCSARAGLDKALEAYNDYLSGLIAGAELSSGDKLPGLSLILNVDDADGSRMSLMSGLHSLALLKNSILIVESKAFSAVAPR